MTRSRHCQRLPPASSKRELHLFECGAPSEAKWTRERFPHFKMIVILTNEQLHGLSYSLHCRGKIATLPLKFRRLVGPIGDNDWRAKLIKMALWT